MERKKFNIIANFDETDSITSDDILVVEGNQIYYKFSAAKLRLSYE